MRVLSFSIDTIDFLVVLNIFGSYLYLFCFVLFQRQKMKKGSANFSVLVEIVGEVNDVHTDML